MIRFSLIICTYKRPQSLVALLESVSSQSKYPDQILIIDGSPGDETMEILKDKAYPRTEYFKVDPIHRGLTKQRNYGLSKVLEQSEIVCFLDDDVILTSNYFENLINTYLNFPDAVGVGGYILDDTFWRKIKNQGKSASSDYTIDGYIRPDSTRFIFRKKMGLLEYDLPTFMPRGGHGRSVGFLPPSGKTYRVETFMGGVASYRKDVFRKIKFSSFFEGYGLYEDTDFTLRLSKIGKLYLNTAAQLYHYHDEDGRPNQLKYGKMVVRNGYYVWRVKYPRPDFKSKVKWHLITGFLILIRFSNIINTRKRKQAFTESIGRISGWVSLAFNNPRRKI